MVTGVASSQDPCKPPPQVTDMYPVARDQNFAIASEALMAVESEVDRNLQNYIYMVPQDHESGYKRIKEYCAKFRRAISCRGGHADVYLPPRPTYPGSSSAAPAHAAYPGSTSAAPAHAPAHVAYPGSSSGTPARPSWTAPPAGPYSYTPRPAGKHLDPDVPRLRQNNL
ncbi:unnamed protein product [Urochloa humidicola]